MVRPPSWTTTSPAPSTTSRPAGWWTRGTRQGSPVGRRWRPTAGGTSPVAGRCGVPATARAVAVSITAVNAGAVGDFRLYPAGSALPLASALNFAPGRTRAGNGIIPLGNGQVSVQCDMPAGSAAAAHLVLDVYGYFE